MRHHRANFWQRRIVKHAALVLRPDSVKHTIRLRTRQQPAFPIQHQSGHIGLSRRIIFFTATRPGDTKNTPAIARPGVKRAISRHRQSPDIFRFWIKILSSLTVFDPINLSVRRTRGIKNTPCIQCQCKNFRPVRSPQQRRGSIGGGNTIHAATMSSSPIKRSIRRGGHAPDHRLSGVEKRLHFRRGRKPSIAAQRHILKLAFQKIREARHFPKGRHRRAAQTHRQKTRQQNPLHGLTSICTVLDPLTSTSPASITISATRELRFTSGPPALPGTLPRTLAMEGGGSGNSSPPI